MVAPRGQRRLIGGRDLLVAAVSEHLPSAHLTAIPTGGLNLWIRLPDGTDLGRLTSGCEAKGVLVAPGDEWFPAEPTGNHLRLAYAGPQAERFPEAARILQAAITRTA